MFERTFYRLTNFALVLFLIVCGTDLRAASGNDAKPNIVLIMCDDMGFSDLGCYGGEVRTPTIDGLAKQGLRFRTFYNNAKCEHTRASLMTGHWWHHVGASPSVHYRQTTLAEHLSSTGYQTWMVGKWHAGQLPIDRGFEKYYGLADGCCNFWNPGDARPGEPPPARKRVRRFYAEGKEHRPYTPESSDFYTTDNFTDEALRWMREDRDREKPLLLYVAFTAPHYPLHASPSDIDEYRNTYRDIGWNKLRHLRFKQQQNLGVLTPNTSLSPFDLKLPSWDEASQEDAKADHWDLRMATYAAMITRMDSAIARLMDGLKECVDMENTLILFLSDNGACEDSLDRSTVAGSMPWEVTSYLTQGRPWAAASNTPFRGYKTTLREGGVRTPMIAVWPKHIPAGTWTNQTGHIVDVVPTALDLAGIRVPETMAGRSLKANLKVPEVEPQNRELFWHFRNERALRNGSWKLYSSGKEKWSLYDLASDPTEINDVAEAQPQLVSKMAKRWQEISDQPDP
ncbi:MAG: sulfatase-like hydrolase/transferase [Planctomycetota bacterium]